MGTFFVFFSTAPRILIDGAGFSEVTFSLAFATAAGVMIITTRFTRRFVEKWGIPGSLGARHGHAAGGGGPAEHGPNLRFRIFLPSSCPCG